jgi:hypothetical protein
MTSTTETNAPHTATCRYCNETIEFYAGIGWVETRSGDDGGHYDFCPENTADDKHRA